MNSGTSWGAVTWITPTWITPYGSLQLSQHPLVTASSFYYREPTLYEKALGRIRDGSENPKDVWDVLRGEPMDFGVK